MFHLKAMGGSVLKKELSRRLEFSGAEKLENIPASAATREADVPDDRLFNRDLLKFLGASFLMYLAAAIPMALLVWWLA